MTDNIVARDLMVSNVREIQEDQTLQSAMQSLVELQSDPASPNALSVLDAEGRFKSLVTARLLFRGLLVLWTQGRNEPKDEELLEKELLEVVHDRARLKVHEALVLGLPAATLDSRILTLIDLVCDQRLEYLPVLEGSRLQGVVPVSRILDAAAGLSLTPEHKGIQKGR